MSSDHCKEPIDIPTPCASGNSIEKGAAGLSLRTPRFPSNPFSVLTKSSAENSPSQSLSKGAIACKTLPHIFKIAFGDKTCF